jgi:hypothetical protein
MSDDGWLSLGWIGAYTPPGISLAHTRFNGAVLVYGSVPVVEANGETSASDYSVSFGHFVITSAPEPVTLALVGGGLLALGLHVKRRRRQDA